MVKSGLISLAVGTFIGIVAWLLTTNPIIGLIAGGVGFAIVFIAFLVFNPKRRYMRMFSTILSLMVLLNAPMLELIGTVANVKFKVLSNDSWLDEITLIIFGIWGVYLLYLDRQENGKVIQKPKDKEAAITESPEAEIEQEGKGTKSANIDKSGGAKIIQKD